MPCWNCSVCVWAERLQLHLFCVSFPIAIFIQQSDILMQPILVISRTWEHFVYSQVSYFKKSIIPAQSLLQKFIFQNFFMFVSQSYKWTKNSHHLPACLLCLLEDLERLGKKDLVFQRSWTTPVGSMPQCKIMAMNSTEYYFMCTWGCREKSFSEHILQEILMVPLHFFFSMATECLSSF